MTEHTKRNSRDGKRKTPAPVIVGHAKTRRAGVIYHLGGIGASCVIPCEKIGDGQRILVGYCRGDNLTENAAMFR